MADDFIKETLTFSPGGFPAQKAKKNLVKIVVAIVVAGLLGIGISLATQIQTT